MVFSNDLRRRFTAIQAEKDAPIFVYPKGMLQTMMGERPDLIKPFYKNSDIQRYFSATETDKELLYADGKTELPPKILKYLRKFKKILKLRRECEEGKIEWWELHWSRTPELFLRPKIVLPYRTYEATFAYNEIPFYAATDVYYITQEKDDKTLLKALLGILNSKLIYTWLYHRGKRKGNMLELFPTILQQIPLVFPKDLKPLVNLVEQRLKLSDASAMCKAVECKIDEFVYELYGLTQEEIAVIEKKG